jgi:hypothetical protein
VAVLTEAAPNTAPAPPEEDIVSMETEATGAAAPTEADLAAFEEYVVDLASEAQTYALPGGQ